MKKSLAERVRAKTHATVSDQCWSWRGFNVGGRGLVTVDGHAMRVARAAWMAANGDVPAGYGVTVVCGNCECVNPAHMALAPVVGGHTGARRPPARDDAAADLAALIAAVDAFRAVWDAEPFDAGVSDGLWDAAHAMFNLLPERAST